MQEPREESSCGLGSIALRLHPEGRPFPWLVSDFGLVDAIESGIVKIPRLPVMDTTGLPDPKYFKLWERAKSELVPSQFHSGKNGRPKAGPLFDKIQGALVQLSGQWKARFEEIQDAKPGQEFIPPVMIVVCDNTEIAEVCYRKISGESEEDEVTLQDIEEVAEEESGDDPEVPARKKGKKVKKRTVYGQSEVLEEFANTPTRQHTIRIDTKRLDEVDEDLRAIVSTVGRKGKPGEHVRCVVSVGMLTEGWDANILANRLARLVQSGLLSRTDNPTHKQKAIYSLTEASIQLVPLLALMGAWGCRFTPASRQLSIRAQFLEEGGVRMWKAFMAELRSNHMGAPVPRR